MLLRIKIPSESNLINKICVVIVIILSKNLKTIKQLQ